MHKLIIGLVSGAIGLATGAVGGYIFCKKKLEAKYYEDLQKAIEKECDILREEHSKISKESPQKVEEVAEPVKIEFDDAPHSYEEMVTIVKAMGRRPEEWDQEDEEDIPPGGEFGSEGPTEIDEDEFRFLPTKYEIRELQYFVGDGTVLDENDDFVEDPGIYISGLEERLQSLGNYHHVYILVERIGVAVDVVTIDGTFEGGLDA